MAQKAIIAAGKEKAPIRSSTESKGASAEVTAGKRGLKRKIDELREERLGSAKSRTSRGTVGRNVVVKGNASKKGTVGKGCAGEGEKVRRS